MGRGPHLWGGGEEGGWRLGLAPFYLFGGNLFVYVYLLTIPKIFFYKQCTLIEEKAQMKGYSRSVSRTNPGECYERTWEEPVYF